MQRNPGCLRACRLDPKVGFVIESGCPVHDREGYTPFTVLWLRGQPVLVGSMSLGFYGDSPDHDHVHVYAFLMGMN